MGIFVGEGTGTYRFDGADVRAQPSRNVYGNSMIGNAGFSLCYATGLAPRNQILWNAYSANGRGTTATLPWSFNPWPDPSNCR